MQLELKTLTVAGAGAYEVYVDLGQLWEYVHKPSGHQPFYTFPHPRPGWDGFLADVATVEGQPVTEAGSSRSGRGLWFANWIAVLPPATVASVLSQELARHGSRGPRQSEAARPVRPRKGLVGVPVAEILR